MKAMPAESILVVDDNAANLRLAQVVLEEAGYEVRTANDAEDALVALETFTPRLILMDLQLPGVDGLELTRRLKRDPTRAGIIVVALTAHALQGDQEKAMAAGCNGYIQKPIDVVTLPEQIARYVVRL